MSWYVMVYFDCLSPFCSGGMANEDNEHFLLHCQRFDLMRIDLLRKLSDIPELDILKLSAKTLCFSRCFSMATHTLT